MLKDMFSRLGTLARKRNPKVRLTFLHLPRTGGTAITQDILFRNFRHGHWCHVNYGPDMQVLSGAHDPLSWTERKRQRISLLAGHMPFGFAEHFPGPSEYVTLLRDPIARVVSDYFFCRQNPTNPAYPFANKLPLVEFVARGYGSSQNCYAQWLSNAAFGARFGSEEEILDAALKNLSQFSLIGITEQFDLSIEHICKRYDLVTYPVNEVNKNAATPEGRSISDEEIQVVRGHNLLDLAIYDVCVKLFMESSSAGSQEPVGDSLAGVEQR
jgi:hypothetical protein